jgi:hypothetical protein
MFIDKKQMKNMKLGGRTELSQAIRSGPGAALRSEGPRDTRGRFVIGLILTAPAEWPVAQRSSQ